MTIARLFRAVRGRFRLGGWRRDGRRHRVLACTGALLAVGAIVVVTPAGAGAPAAPGGSDRKRPLAELAAPEQRAECLGYALVQHIRQ